MKLPINFTAALFVVLMSQNSNPMNAQDIKLPQPEISGGTPFNEVVTQRHSSRLFNSAKLPDHTTIGQLLWTSVGVNRTNPATPLPGKKPADRTNPTAVNAQEITAYLFGKDGVWEYMPQSHLLHKINDTDLRPLLAGTEGFKQDFVLQAPFSILFTADLSQLPPVEHAKLLAAIDAGIACENLNLACAALGIATVPRATMDSAAIIKALNLPDHIVPILNNPIGYAAE